MASFTLATLAGSVLAKLPLDVAALDMVVGDLLKRLPPFDDRAGVPRLLLGPRALGWSERLADLALAPGIVVTLVLVPDPEKAAADLMGTDCTPVRLAAARALRTMGAAAAVQAGKLVDAAMSDPDAEVVVEAVEALRDIGMAVQGSETFQDVSFFRRMVQLAHDLEDPKVLRTDLDFSASYDLTRRLEALLARCDASSGQAALRRRTILRWLALVDPDAVFHCHEPLLADPLYGPTPEARLAAEAEQR